MRTFLNNVQLERSRIPIAENVADGLNVVERDEFRRIILETPSFPVIFISCK